MISKLVKLLIVVALVFLVANIFPTTYEWVEVAIDWFLSFGKWGVITLFACCVVSVTSLFD